MEPTEYRASDFRVSLPRGLAQAQTDKKKNIRHILSCQIANQITKGGVEPFTADQLKALRQWLRTHENYYYYGTRSRNVGVPAHSKLLEPRRAYSDASAERKILSDKPQELMPSEASHARTQWEIVKAAYRDGVLSQSHFEAYKSLYDGKTCRDPVTGRLRQVIDRRQVNAAPSSARVRTGLRDDGERPDLRTAEGRDLFEKEVRSEERRRTGLTKDKVPDRRTSIGRAKLAAEADSFAGDDIVLKGSPGAGQPLASPDEASRWPVVSERVATGLRADGQPDMRTTLGRKLKLAEEAAKNGSKVAAQAWPTGQFANLSRAPASGADQEASPLSPVVERSQPSAQPDVSERVLTGLKNDGEPDMRTTVGRELAADDASSSFGQEMPQPEMFSDSTSGGDFGTSPEVSDRVLTGLRNDGEPDMRTTVGRDLAADDASSSSGQEMPQPEMFSDSTSGGGDFGTSPEVSDRVLTGLRNDGEPDMRTTVGRELAADDASSSSGQEMPQPEMFSDSTSGGGDVGTSPEVSDRVLTGLRNDGEPDMRTSVGRELAGEEAT